MRYWLKPRLYAVGAPDSQSPVFVTANYKMSFDRLRSSLAGRNGWILVLDTKGINVWCAAGKGSFGSDELVRRIEATGLSDVVSHRKLIVPQLGAVGVAAHEVRERSGFGVIYGPVRTDDLPDFLDAGMKANSQMRRVEFPLWDRLSVAVVELVLAAEYLLPVIVALLLLGGLGSDGYDLSRVFSSGGLAAVLVLISFLGGTIAGPALLPWLPGRAFSLKGLWVGVGLAASLWLVARTSPALTLSGLDLAAWMLLMPATTSFTMMNYTGSSTYTSLSGVRREMRRAVPLQVIGGILGAALWIAGRFA
jgi:acetyl-CoA decarbonylase/synthase complex subunit gamma